MPAASCTLHKVLKSANISYVEVHYFNARVKQEIDKWPVGIYADFLRLVMLMENHGADLRMPHSRTMGRGLFELRCKGQEGIVSSPVMQTNQK